MYQLYQTHFQKAQFEGLADLKVRSKQNYEHFLEKAYHEIQFNRFSQIEISTLFNVNREIHASNKALILAIKDLILQDVQAGDFDDLPNAG